MLVAVNRPYGKSDYIPCILWGRNARFAANFEVGSRVQIWGRIQSREYVKRLEDDRTEKRTAYRSIRQQTGRDLLTVPESSKMCEPFSVRAGLKSSCKSMGSVVRWSGSK